MRRVIYPTIIGALILIAQLHNATMAVEEDNASAQVIERECEQEFQVAVRYQVSANASQRSRLKVTIHEQEGAGYAVTVVPRITDSSCRISLIKWVGNHVTVLAAAYRSTLKVGDETNYLSIKYRYGKMTVLHNRRRLFIRYDDQLLGGKTRWVIEGSGISVKEARYQPTEPIVLSDDFMRGSEDVQHWERVSGNWTPVGADSSKFDPRLSANPFSIQAVSTSNALALTGYWFWDNYTFKAAVRPRAENGAVGLAVYAQDANNYILFRWSSIADGGKQQLLVVEDGRQRILAERNGGFVPMQWYELAVRIQDDRLMAFIDGELCLSARTDDFGEGKVGLYADGKMVAQFDDVHVESCDGFADDFDEPLLGRWQILSGNWYSAYQAAIIKPRRRHSRRHSSSKESANVHWLSTGLSTWRDYAISVHGKVSQHSAIGIAVYFQDPQNAYLFRWASSKADVPYRGKCQLVKLVNGKASVLAELRRRLPVDKWQRIRMTVREGTLYVHLNNQLAMAVADVTYGSGKIALFHEGNGRSAFRYVRLNFLPARMFTPKITAQFTKETTMTGWASARGTWREVNGIYWHKADFFGATWMRYLLPPLKSFRGILTFIINGEEGAPDAGYKLTVDGSPNDELQLTLQRNGETISQKALKRDGDQPVALEFQRVGEFITTMVDEKPVLVYRDRTPLTGRDVGVQAQKFNLDFDALQAASEHLCDYTFSNAPVDWWVGRGSWEVTERWTCSPQWSFFGGKDSRTPVLWSKRAFKGDIVVEAYVSVRMHHNGYNYPGDLNITICGDGLNLDSGYSFIYAGWNNTRSRILKGTEVLAERTDALGHLTKPMRSYHRYWWYLRVEKRGNNLRMFVDDKLVLEAKDEHPLPGGRVALWTLNKGILVARVRIWYEAPMATPKLHQLVAPVLLAKLSAQSSGEGENATATTTAEQVAQTMKVDFERGIGSFTVNEDVDNKVILKLDDKTAARGRHSLRIINAISGGRFEVIAWDKQFDAVKYPILRFAYCVQPDVKVDIVVKARGREFVVHFTGNALPEKAPQLLGSIQNVRADGRWHIAEFNLRDALIAKFGQASSLPVQRIAFANVSSDGYLFAGIGGNHFGTAYRLDDFALLPASAKAVARKP